MEPRESIGSLWAPGKRRTIGRRSFLRQAAAMGLSVSPWMRSTAQGRIENNPGTGNQGELDRRVRGMFVGSLLGDALGGPVEFQLPESVHHLVGGPRSWTPGETLDAAAIAAAARRVKLRGYSELRPEPEPYAHWTRNAGPGTVTDDSRHKMVLMHALRRRSLLGFRPLQPIELADAYVEWRSSRAIVAHREYDRLKEEWLQEFDFAIHWLHGERDPTRALPPERLWQGLPTCCGQMSLLPLAGIHVGDPMAAYRHAYDVAFFDNGFGKDLNAAIVAGISRALALPTPTGDVSQAWKQVSETMRTTDPYRYREVPWTYRSVDRWLDLADRVVNESERQPFRFFACLDREFQETIKWEAQVPFVVTFGCARLCEYDPLASLQLSVEWGHDTDSYPQLLGAFVGALHGDEVFPAEAIELVSLRLREDYGEDLEEWVRLLSKCRSELQAGQEGDGRVR